MFVLFKDAWTEQELRDLEAKRIELGLWKKGAERFRYRQDEFPQADQFMAFAKDVERDKPAAPRKTAEKKVAKRLKKVRDGSRRKNRGGKK